jgi:signal transduction histidine kinase
MTVAPTGSSTSAVLRVDLERERERTELRTRFLSLVSHEFRTPLTVILSSVELLENYGDGWNEIRRRSHFRRIQASIADMTALLDNVSLLAKFDSGNYAISPDSVPLADTLLAVAEETAPFRKEGQKLTTSVHPGSGAAVVDPRLLHAVATNLLANASRFSPADCIVHASLRLVPEGLELMVSDRGPGLVPGEEEIVWSAFERGSNAKGVPGSGLGLAIVRRCMELARGGIELRPREGGGLEAVAFFPSGALP